MSNTEISHPGPRTLDLVAAALAGVGVAGNEDDRPFSAEEIAAALPGLEERLRAQGALSGGLELGGLARPHDEVDVLVFDKGRFSAAEQAERAWEAEYSQRWHERVEQRVDDWVLRLSNLRSNIEQWLAASDLRNISLVELPPIEMSEAPMRRFAVRPRYISGFDLRSGATPVMRFLPKGLWVIGANGRVDLITKTAAPILIDRSKPMSPPADWHFHDSRERREAVPFTSRVLLDLVRAGLP